MKKNYTEYFDGFKF